jgi:protein involved in ribonucleotide reduction
MEPIIAYYSSPTLNTHRFIESLGFRAVRIPVSMKDDVVIMNEPYILMSPSYGDNAGNHAVPKQVIRFLNEPQNRKYIRGVIGSGNRNFGDMFARAGTIIANKCKVPLLYKVELSGTSNDIMNVQMGVRRLWEALKQNSNLTQMRA